MLAVIVARARGARIVGDARDWCLDAVDDTSLGLLAEALADVAGSYGWVQTAEGFRRATGPERRQAFQRIRAVLA